MEVRANSSTRMLRAPGFILVNVTPNADIRTRKGCAISPQKVRPWFIVVGLWPACTLLAGCLTTLSSLPYWDTVVFSNHAVPLDFLQLLGHSESEQNLDIVCCWFCGLSQVFTIPGTFLSRIARLAKGNAVGASPRWSSGGSRFCCWRRPLNWSSVNRWLLKVMSGYWNGEKEKKEVRRDALWRGNASLVWIQGTRAMNGIRSLLAKLPNYQVHFSCSLTLDF